MRVSRPSSSVFSGQWVATVALLAMLIQALASGAMAHGVTDKGVPLIICSAQGATTVTVGHDGKAQLTDVVPGKLKGQAAGLPCQDCVTASTAAIVPPPTPVVSPVRYAHKTQVWGAVATVIHQKARPPPRPPSRAPPTI